MPNQMWAASFLFLFNSAETLKDLFLELLSLSRLLIELAVVLPKEPNEMFSFFEFFGV